MAFVIGALIALGFFIVLFYYIAKNLGGTRHIGVGWSIALLIFGGLIIGLIAIMCSPSVNEKPSKGNILHLIFGILVLLINPVLGIYLILLYNGAIVNQNPTNNYSVQPQNLGNTSYTGGYNGGYSQTTPVNNNEHTQTDNGVFYNGGHNARINIQTPQQPNRPQRDKGEFNGNLYN